MNEKLTNADILAVSKGWDVNPARSLSLASSALEDYYRLCDWDVETGHPSLKKMESLGLGWVVAENEVLSQVVT